MTTAPGPAREPDPDHDDTSDPDHDDISGSVPVLTDEPAPAAPVRRFWAVRRIPRPCSPPWSSAEPGCSSTTSRPYEPTAAPWPGGVN